MHVLRLLAFLLRTLTCIFCLVKLTLVMDSNMEIAEVQRKKTANPEGDQQLSSQLESLPHDLILYILSRLPLSCLVPLKSSCRGWHVSRTRSRQFMPHIEQCLCQQRPALLCRLTCLQPLRGRKGEKVSFALEGDNAAWVLCDALI